MCEVAEKIYEQGIEQGLEQGIEKGIEQGEMEKAKATAVKLYHKGWKEAEIADLLNYGIEIVKGWLGLSLA